MNIHRQQNSGSRHGIGSREQTQGTREQPSQGGNPQSDRSYSETGAGVHKSKLGGANRQAGSGRPAGVQQGDRSNSHQSSDSPLQSGDTGTDEDAGNERRGGGAGRAAQKPGHQP